MRIDLINTKENFKLSTNKKAEFAMKIKIRCSE